MKEYKSPIVEMQELNLGDCSLGNLCSGVGDSIGTSTGSGETGIYNGDGGIFA